MLEQNIEKYVLELTDPNHSRDIDKAPLDDEIRIDRSQHVVRLYSDNIEHLKSLTNLLEGSHYYLRQANLEDVFLKATGRGLDEK